MCRHDDGRAGQGEQRNREQARGTSHRWKVALSFAAAACGPPAAAPPVTAPVPSVGNGAPTPLRDVWPLERLGASPRDTMVRFAAVSGRTIVLRHPRPDNAIFVIITIPGGAMQPQQGDSVTVQLSPVPGRYGLAFRSDDRLTGIALGTFSYGVHFAAPEGAAGRYPNATRFEAAMGAAFLLDSASLRFLPAERPAGDMMRFAIARAGTYLLAAPR